MGRSFLVNRALGRQAKSSSDLFCNQNGLPSETATKVNSPQATNRDRLKRSAMRLGLITATAVAGVPRRSAAVSELQASGLTVNDQQTATSDLMSVTEQLAILENEKFSGAASKVIKSTSDSRIYSAITLENGLRVLLISDPDASRGAAAMDVHVGSTSDPTNVPGLAHFCEHMSFLGTKKYPTEDDFSSFLSSHGGSTNAYTDQEDTVYYFDVNADFLDSGLDRFSQFFTSPTFRANSTNRELNAIESEHSKNINSDGFRIFQVRANVLMNMSNLTRQCDLTYCVYVHMLLFSLLLSALLESNSPSSLPLLKICILRYTLYMIIYIIAMP